MKDISLSLMTTHTRLLQFIVLCLLIALPVGAQEGGFANSINTPTPREPVNSDSTPDASAIPETSATQATTDAVPVRIFEPESCTYVRGQLTNDECRTLIETYGTDPDVTPIDLDRNTLGQYSFWRVGPDAVTKYDAPNGAVVGTIPAGFNFVNAINSSVEGWLQIEGGEWIQQSAGYYVAASNFTGVRLPDGWNQPFGWILDTTGIYTSLYPGGESTAESGLIPLHYERYNIYAEAVDDEGWTWYMIGADQWVKQIYMTVIKPVARPEGVQGRWVAIDLFEQSLVAYEDDQPVFATLISTGLPGTETNEGVFEVWARLDRDGMSGATGAPNAYALQSVPWVMYFDNSISLHGTYWHDLFGYRRSRGCVNLSISDARWVYDWTRQTEAVTDNGLPLTYVYVHSSDEYRES